MRRMKHVKRLKKMYRLTCQVLAACAITSTALLVNGGVVFAAESREPNNQTLNLTADPGESIAASEVNVDTEVDEVTANGNTVNVKESDYKHSIAGGVINIAEGASANVAMANGNTVNIDNGTSKDIHGAIWGGGITSNVENSKIGKAQTDNNAIKIVSGKFVSQSNSDICGGYVSGPMNSIVQANGNTVEIENIEIKVKKDSDMFLNRSIYGGYATTNGDGSATANNNSVTISGGDIELFPSGVDNFSESKIYGGLATNGKNNTANGNTLKINGGTFSCYAGGINSTEIGGGLGYNGTANGNKVIITGGTIGSEDNKIHVYGGNAGKEANVNEVLIDGATIYGKVAGGHVHADNPSIVEGNKVTIVAGAIKEDVYGGYSSNGTVKGNKVIVAGGTIDVFVYGGCGGAEFGVAEGNEVTVTGGEIIGTITGGTSGYNGTAQNNIVEVSGGNVKGDVIGGYSYNNGTAQNNTVEVSGGTVKGDVIGGVVLCFDENYKPTFNNNTIILGAANGEGKANITGNVYVNRAEFENSSSVEKFAQPGGNLNVYNTGNSVGGSVNASGANVNFYVKDSDLNQADPMLNVGEKADLSHAKIVAHVQSLGSVAGSSINLLKADTIVNAGATCIITDGFLENSSLEFTTGALKASKVDASKTTANENSKSPSETQVVGVALVNAALDAVAGDGFSEAAKAIKGGAEGSREMQPFATMGGSAIRQKSGSYVDVKSWNTGLGFAKAVENKNGKLMFGPVVDYGRGKYDSYLDNGTHGDGKSSFYALGGMVKQENNNGVYYEGSLLLGRLKNDYSSDIMHGLSYENSANFYAMHAGIGKMQHLQKDVTLDYYGKLFFNHQNSSSANLSSGHIYGFDAVNSIRSRLGVRYTHQLSAGMECYAGFAWQHEFDSKAQATIRSGIFSASAPAPSVKGETGIFELGIKDKPGNGNVETNLGIIGSVGKQKGMGFNAQIQWNF